MAPPDVAGAGSNEATFMVQATHTEKPDDARVEIAHLQDLVERVRAESERLRSENQHLRSTLDAHVARAGSTRAYGPLELTAGTSVGPWRRRMRREPAES